MPAILDSVRTRATKVQRAAWLGAGLAATGFVIMYLGWRGSARTFFVPSQMAFVITGALLGLGTLATGLTILGAHLLRINTERRARHMHVLRDDVLDLVVLARARRAAE